VMKAVAVLCVLLAIGVVRAFEDQGVEELSPVEFVDTNAVDLTALSATATVLARVEKLPGWLKLSSPSAATMKTMVGGAGCPLKIKPDKKNPCWENGSMGKHVKTEAVNPATPSLRLTAFPPFLAAVKAGFAAAAAAVKAKQGDWAGIDAALKAVKTQGAYCCRPINHNGKPGSTHSNHSWGMAMDIGFGGMDKQNDHRTQKGLELLAPFFNKQKLNWGARFSTEDSMHFEASTELLNEWKRANKLIKI